MSLQNNKFSFNVMDSIHRVDASQWNLFAQREEYSPFLEYEFLAALESAGCASPTTGWYPAHFILNAGERIIGIAPAYIKTHSMGEFIFDQGLAHALMNMGKKYYPKLVGTLPFTPSPGYRFLVDPDHDETVVTQALLEGMSAYCDRMELASHSLLFLDPDWKAFNSSPSKNSFSSWEHQYYLWENRSYTAFYDYLDRFNKNQRRNIRRERDSVKSQGIEVKCFSGKDVTESIMDKMFDFYQATNEKFGMWAAFFLNRQCFHDLGRNWGHRLIIFAAFHARSDEPVAMSLLVNKDKHLIGRYWGASEFIQNLHFELCYYSPLEYAIQNDIKFFDPGMGSTHKTRRGFGSRHFLSCHLFSDMEINQLFKILLHEANRCEHENIEKLNESVPWSKSQK